MSAVSKVIFYMKTSRLLSVAGLSAFSVISSIQAEETKVQPTENIRLISKNCNQAILLSWNYKKTMIEKLKKNNFKGKVLVFSPKIEVIKL